jgi:hypothetical protein
MVIKALEEHWVGWRNRQHLYANAAPHQFGLHFIAVSAHPCSR